MKEKTVAMVFALIAVLLMVLSGPPRVVNAAPTGIRFISDVTELGPGNVVGTTFTVAVVVEDVNNLYGLDVQIGWTTEYVHCIHHVTTIPFESYPTPIPPSPYGGILHAPYIPVKDVVNESKGISGADPETMAWFAAASILPSPTFNGNGTVAVFTFNVTDQPYLPQNATFRIHGTSATLADNGGVPIPYVIMDLEIPLYGRPPPNIKITYAQAYPKMVCYGSVLHVDVNITNDAGYPVATNVTMYANGTGVATLPMTIEAYNTTTVTVNASVTIAGGLDLANYSIMVYAWPILGESTIEDNTFNCGIITVKLIGDVDGDLDVDILDVVQITSIYGAKKGEPQYNPSSDLDHDGIITILDVVTCVAHYGYKYP